MSLHAHCLLIVEILFLVCIPNGLIRLRWTGKILLCLFLVVIFFFHHLVFLLSFNWNRLAIWTRATRNGKTSVHFQTAHRSSNSLLSLTVTSTDILYNLTAKSFLMHTRKVICLGLVLIHNILNIIKSYMEYFQKSNFLCFEFQEIILLTSTGKLVMAVMSRMSG